MNNSTDSYCYGNGDVRTQSYVYGIYAVTLCGYTGGKGCE
jgi:hypothetical protein